MSELVHLDAQPLVNRSDRTQQLVAFCRAHMKRGRDFGAIAGGQRPILFKPGAEKLVRLFGLATHFEMCHMVEDFTGKENGEPLFYYRYRCTLTWNGQAIAQSEGSCNSWEKKYRNRRDKFDLVNTLQKMAQKRALVSATLLATGASELFEQ
ncbi:hypothetical protein KR51_00019260 [Rubidibacter lacunae KORDI 51-2]|uniref:Uncharacterized protein n=1 Tax=Rubidibacter lacunae KORDI 51-2 TaxID=582515 RepID=U5DLA6_9CHRO|nr:hypothetical protein [Rubidibacter lacunae]ERN41359.1 hypothetical protein KR51_00019260 [Rubidibacter lacunae KORDI 51-2]